MRAQRQARAADAQTRETEGAALEEDEAEGEEGEEGVETETRGSVASCLISGGQRRTKRESQLSLRSLLATFKSLAAGDLSGGLLQPFTVSPALILLP